MYTVGTLLRCAAGGVVVQHRSRRRLRFAAPPTHWAGCSEWSRVANLLAHHLQAASRRPRSHPATARPPRSPLQSLPTPPTQKTNHTAATNPAAALQPLRHVLWGCLLAGRLARPAGAPAGVQAAVWRVSVGAQAKRVCRHCNQTCPCCLGRPFTNHTAARGCTDARLQSRQTVRHQCERPAVCVACPCALSAGAPAPLRAPYPWRSSPLPPSLPLGVPSVYQRRLHAAVPDGPG